MICPLPRSAADSLAEMGTLALQSALDLAAYENRYLFSQVFGVFEGREDRRIHKEGGADADPAPAGRNTDEEAGEGAHQALSGAAGWFYEEGMAWALSPAAAEEGAAFMKKSGWESLWCDENVARFLRPFLVSCTMRPAAALTASGIGGTREEAAEFSRPQEVYRLLAVSGAWEKAPSFDGWYSDYSHRARRGMRRLYGIRENGVLASTATADVLGKYVLLRDVATRPEFRGKGLCSRMLRHLFAQYPGSRFHLLTDNPAARRVYERAGFETENDNLVRIHKENSHAAGIF